MKTIPKYRRGDTVFILLCDDAGTITDRYGNHLTLRTLKVAKSIYYREYKRWEYHCPGWLSTFAEHELYQTPEKAMETIK